MLNGSQTPMASNQLMVVRRLADDQWQEQPVRIEAAVGASIFQV